MRQFLVPTRRKLLRAAAILAGCIGLFCLRLIPHRMDLFDVSRLAIIPMRLLLAWPIRLFDFVTADRFVSHSEAFLVFPTLPEILFAFVFDLVAIYLVACGITARGARGEQHR